MNLKVSNTNAPVWRDITVYAELPAKLKCLDELAHNVWWSWNSDAKNYSTTSTLIHGGTPGKIRSYYCKN